MRRQVNDSDQPSETTAQTPKRSRTKKADAIAPTPEVTAEAPAPAKRPARRSPKKTETEQPALVEVAAPPVEAPRAKRSSRTKPAEAEAVAAPEAQPKARRGRKSTTEAPLMESGVIDGVSISFRPRQQREEAPAAEPAPKESRSGRGRGRGRSQRDREDAEPSAPQIVQTVELTEGESLAIAQWRTPTYQESTESESSTNLAPRRSRNKRRKDKRDRDITAAAALTVPEKEAPAETGLKRSSRDRRRSAEPAAQPEPEPVFQLPPQRPAIPIPNEAPQVIMRNGVPTLVRNGRVLSPLFLFGSSPDEGRLNTVLEEIKMASDAGVHIFVHYLEFEIERSMVDETAAFAGFLLKKTLEIDPSAQVIFRVVFSAPKDWETRYPKAKYEIQAGGPSEPSFCDDEFWDEAESLLRLLVAKLRMLETRDSILGFHLERGEWFFASGWGYDTSIAAHEKFRQWARVRYRDDVASLRAAWFDGQVHFQTLNVPQYTAKSKPGEEFVRTGRKARRWVDYHLFLSDSTVDRITQLAYAVKESSEGMFLVGVSYGYTFEWSHPANGHLSLGKLLRTPEVDFIAGPPSYKNREPGGSCPFPCPIDSFALNGKLYISEEDFKTPISGRQEPDDFNPVMKTPQALESVHWRGAGSALAHSAGICWMDLWGNGWLHSLGIWQRGSRILQELNFRMAVPPSEPDVAVFIDERSLAYLVDEAAFTLLVQNVRESILRSGMSVGFYLLSDLAHREAFPESKLYVFMNAWDVRPEVRSAIKNRLQRGNKVLFWLYVGGLFDGGRESLERVREVTGIALKPQPFASKPGTSILNRRHPLCEALPERTLHSGGQLEPSYFAIPEDGVVLGEYTQTGLPSFVIREFQIDGKPELAWKSVFLGEPIVTPGLFRALGQIAGCHIWNYHEDVVHVRAPFVTVHCSGAGTRTITIPDRWAAYDTVHNQWTGVDATHLRFNAHDGHTYTFLVGPQGELETLLNTNIEDLLTIDQLPDKQENTLPANAYDFDVQIMKLDEWMEESWDEEFAEDFLLKPSALDVSIPVKEEETEHRNRRRRRRGGRKERSNDEPKGEPVAATPASNGDLTVNVVFRKREQ